jgi:hypothetical protein
MKEIVSVEKVLNSRCSCDFDGDPKKNHWGVFVKDRYPSRKIIDHVLRCCRKAPQFSKGKLLFWFEDKHLFLGFEKTTDPFNLRLLHIESGMQHEAVYLACTALGLGTCISNLGVNGTEYANKIATARHIILEKAESYNEGKFTTAAPGPERFFRKGKDLTLPRRNGKVECLRVLERLTLSDDDGADADEADISQLLWAAKGRTPHYVKSHPWGLTIPTWGGGQEYTSVYLVKENKLFRYINWTTRFFPFRWIMGKPTHDINFVRHVKVSLEPDYANSIILSRNEETNRALWEVGYMLENMFLQAKSLGISYKSKVFTKDDIGKLERSGISEAVAAFFL